MHNIFTAIEFPGFVNNVDNVLECLGGLESMEKVLETSLSKMELRYRPGNTFCHPVVGQVIDSNSLVCKKIVKRRKDGTLVSSEIKIIGFVARTTRFRSYADFQFNPETKNDLFKLVDNINKGKSLIDVDNFDFADFAKTTQCNTDPNNLNLLPPPIFTSLHVPFHYNFRSGQSVVQLVRDDGIEEQVLVSRRKSRKLDNHEIKFTSGIVPSSPKPLLPTEREEDVLGNISAKEAELILNRLKELFDERPIWTRNAIRIMLLPITKKLDDINARWLSPALSRISYLFTTGPWRNCWVKFGYDPRTDFESRKYQIVDFRFAVQTIAGLSNRLVGEDKRQNNLHEDSLLYSDPKTRIGVFISKFNGINDYFHFDGKFAGIKPGDTTSYPFPNGFQLCDLQQPFLIKLVDLNFKRPSVCDVNYGWFPKSQIKTIRRAVKIIIECHFFPDIQRNRIPIINMTNEQMIKFEKSIYLSWYRLARVYGETVKKEKNALTTIIREISLDDEDSCISHDSGEDPYEINFQNEDSDEDYYQ